MTDDIKKCSNCTYLLTTGSILSEFRCGYDYFQLSPSLRLGFVVEDLNLVDIDYTCDNWKTNNKKNLRMIRMKQIYGNH